MPLGVSVLKGKGKGKDGKNKDGKCKDGKGKTKGKDGKDKAEPTSSSQNKDKKCFYCDKIGHVKADCRKKKRDDEKRKTTLAQHSLTSPSDATSLPGLTNAPANTSGTSASSLPQLTVPSHVSDDEFHITKRIFALNAGLQVDWVMVDSVQHTALVHSITQMSMRSAQDPIPDGQR